MATSGGPNTIQDGLVFGYDTGYPNIISRFNKGEPTTNLVTNTPSQGGWSGTYSVLNSNTKSFKFSVSNFNGTPGQGWRSFMWDVTEYSGSQMTISANVESIFSDTGTFAWLMIGHTSASHDYLGYAPASNRYQKTGTSAEKISWSGQVGYGTKIGFTLWMNNGIPGTHAPIKVSNVQIESKPHKTPFIGFDNTQANGSDPIAGVRHHYKSLMDLVNTDASRQFPGSDIISTSNIDVSTMSFDTNSEMHFDGTNDYIGVSHTGFSENQADVTYKGNGGNWTVESMVKYDAVPASYNNNTSPGNFIGSAGISYNSWYWSVLSSKLAIWNISPGIWKYGSTTLQADTWYHAVLVCEAGGTTYKMYLNGVEEGGTHSGYAFNASYSGLKVGWIGRGNSSNPRVVNGKIPITRIYDKAFTASEVKQNFEALRKRFNI